ncbi:MAG: hypothetical protein IJC16_02235 [Rikenellaceae bacterium]|nr:hypothetical protein [Rikenellaceae bacterium]
MGKKLTVKICTGTLCYVMGGADLQLLDEQLSPELLSRVDIMGSPCLDCCNHDDSAQAPFVKVGERVVSGATISKVIDAIKDELSKQ